VHFYQSSSCCQSTSQLLHVAQMLVGTVFALSAVMMGAKFYIDRNVQREDVRPYPLLWSSDLKLPRTL